MNTPETIQLAVIQMAMTDVLEENISRAIEHVKKSRLSRGTGYSFA